MFSISLRNQIMVFNLNCFVIYQAFLAYGLHDKRMKSTDMILKVHPIL